MNPNQFIRLLLLLALFLGGGVQSRAAEATVGVAVGITTKQLKTPLVADFAASNGLATATQLNAASNALVTLSRSQDTTTSNALVTLAYLIGTQSTNYTVGTSNLFHSIWLTGSNNLAGLITAGGSATNAQPPSANLTNWSNTATGTVATITQLNTASNALVTISRSQDTTTSNALVAFSYTIGAAATNYTLSTSNYLLTLAYASDAAGSNALQSLAYTIGAQSTNYTLGASNSMHALWLSGSNVLAGLGVTPSQLASSNYIGSSMLQDVNGVGFYKLTNTALVSTWNLYADYDTTGVASSGNVSWRIRRTNIWTMLSSAASPAIDPDQTLIFQRSGLGVTTGYPLQMSSSNLYVSVRLTTSNKVFLAGLSTNASPVSYLGKLAGGEVVETASPSAGAQSPWTATINGAGYGATNIGSLQVNGAINSASLNITALSQGFTSLTVASATAVTVDLGQKYEIHATNNLVFTNWTGLSSTNANDSQIWVYCRTNITITWPAFRTPVLGAYFGTNANAPMWTSGTNGDWLVISASAMRTNVALTITKF